MVGLCMGLPQVNEGRGQFSPLRSLSLAGSLRFWLVVLCMVVAVSKQGSVVFDHRGHQGSTRNPAHTSILGIHVKVLFWHVGQCRGCWHACIEHSVWYGVWMLTQHQMCVGQSGVWRVWVAQSECPLHRGADPCCSTRHGSAPAASTPTLAYVEGVLTSATTGPHTC